MKGEGMNKEQLIRVITEQLNTSKVETEAIVITIINTIMEAAKEKGECVIPGLGKLKVEDVPAKSGVSFGKEWTKPAHKKFKLVVNKKGKEFLEK